MHLLCSSIPHSRCSFTENPEQARSEQDSTGIDVHAASLVYGSNCFQRLNALLVEEGLHVAIVPSQIHTVVLAGFNVFFEADYCCSIPAPVDEERIKEEQNVTGQQQHTFPDASRHGRHSDQELVKKSR